MKRRDFHRAAIAAAASCVAVPEVRAQDRPPIKLRVGYAPGGSADAVARALAQRLATLLGQPVIVENHAGAGGRIAVQELKRAPADGNTLLFTPAGPFTIWPWIYPASKLGYDPFKDFVQIASVSKMDFGVMINLRNPEISDFKTLIAHVRSSPKDAAFASPGPGTLPHFLGLMLANALNVPLQHVAYKGSGPAMNDLLGGQFPMMVDTLWVDRHKSRQLKIVATTGKRRYRELPDVPTLRELGVDLAADQHFAICAPAGVAPDTVRRLSDAVRDALKAQDLQETLFALGQEPSYLDPRQVAEVQLAQYRYWEKPIKASGYSAD